MHVLTGIIPFKITLSYNVKEILKSKKSLTSETADIWFYCCYKLSYTWFCKKLRCFLFHLTMEWFNVIFVWNSRNFSQRGILQEHNQLSLKKLISIDKRGVGYHCSIIENGGLKHQCVKVKTEGDESSEPPKFNPNNSGIRAQAKKKCKQNGQANDHAGYPITTVIWNLVREQLRTSVLKYMHSKATKYERYYVQKGEVCNKCGVMCYYLWNELQVVGITQLHQYQLQYYPFSSLHRLSSA